MNSNSLFYLIINKYRNYLFLLVGIGVFFLSKNNGFFWDNVLFASKMGNHLYENSIFNWTIPDSFDPGHPPFLAFLLAIFWRIFGQNLWSSHLLMLPFIFGVFYQLHKLLSYFFKSNKYILLGILFVVIDPTLAAQFVLVNPEIIIVFFFLLALNGIVFNSKKAKIIGLLILSIISFRSMMLFGGLLLFDIINSLYINKLRFNKILNLKFIFEYILTCLPGVIYVLRRLSTKGWLQTHPNSPWSTLWEVATPKIFLKNVVVLFWRYIDFGRIFLFIFLIALIFLFGKQIFKDKKNVQLLCLSISSVIFIIIISLLATNSFGHRYFIISFIALNILTYRIIINHISKRKIIYSILFLGLFSGNFWIYPKHISQGWDATLSHLPYHSLRNEAINYLNENKIPIDQVDTFFPNYHPINTIDFSDDYRGFKRFSGDNKYVFYSTVYNLSDENLAILDEKYQPTKEFEKLNIKIIIYTLK